jgi:solute carrier family 30 (zinc transporter), member 1
MGLLSNFVGLVLFHGEISRSSLISLTFNHILSFAFTEHGHSHSHSHPEPADVPTLSTSHKRSRSSQTHAHKETTPLIISPSQSVPTLPSHQDDSDSEASDDNDDEETPEALLVHPISIRDNVIRKAQNVGYGSLDNGNNFSTGKKNSWTRSRSKSDGHPHGRQASLDRKNNIVRTEATIEVREEPQHEHNHVTNGHDHRKEAHSHSHDHGHGGMNMKGVFLHVLGDAVSNP